jgi:DNA-binding transcriptional MocR family regulator
MRLGWINAGRWHARVEMLKYTQSRNNEALSQIAAASFIDSPEFERHLQRLRSSLKKQRAQMADAVGKYFPQGTRMNEPEGGLSLWIELPNHPSSESIFKHALEQGIIIAPGTIFSNSNRFSSFIRLNCGATYTDSIDAAMKTLGKIIKHHTKV